MEKVIDQVTSQVLDMVSMKPQFHTTIAVFIIIGVIAVFIGFSFRKYDAKKVNSKFQIMCEIFYEYFYNIAGSMLGDKRAQTFAPLATVMFLSVFLGNIASILILPVESATINPFYTFTWSISMFIVWTVYGIYKSGILSFTKKAFIGEIWLMAPMETLGYLTKPISLGARMMGNISAGALIVMAIWYIPMIIVSFVSNIFANVLVSFASVFIFSIIGSMLMGFFTLFGPFIQATVFTYLTLCYFASVLPEEE